MFGIDGQFLCEIQIDGRELPLQLGGFEDIMLVENTQLYVPQFRLSVYDGAGILDGVRAVVDGTPVTIMLGRSHQDNEPPERYEFRAFGPPKQSMAGGRSLYTIAGVLDAMKYFRGQAVGSFQGRSSDAIAKIAADCTLRTNLVSTNDSMVWLFGRRTHCSLANFISSHGWVNDRSAMALGLNCKKTLIYKNLAMLVREQARVVFWSGDPPNDPLLQPIHTTHFDIGSSSGLRNSLFGYGSTSVEQRLDGTVERMERTNVTMLSDSLEMNSEVRDQVGRVRTPYLPPDAGNGHPQFQRAQYQNRQALNTFSTRIDTLHQQASGVTLLDPVQLHIAPGGNDTLARTYNGKYVVTAKTRCIRGTGYFEKHRLMTQGRQTDATGDLVG